MKREPYTGFYFFTCETYNNIIKYVRGDYQLNVIFKGRDIFLFSIYAIFGSFVFETSIFVMFLSKRGVGYSQMMSLFSIMALSVIILEYLTGVLADKYSRKWTLILSTGTFILAETVFVLGNNFYIFTVGIILMAVSVASKSGADMAYLYDKLLETGRENSFEDIASSLGSIGLIVSAASCMQVHSWQSLT